MSPRLFPHPELRFQHREARVVRRFHRALVVLVAGFTLSTAVTGATPVWAVAIPGLSLAGFLVALGLLSAYFYWKGVPSSAGAPGLRPRQVLQWTALFLVWVPLNGLTGGPIVATWTIGDHVVSAPATSIQTFRRSPTRVTYPVDGERQTHPVESFPHFQYRLPQQVVFAPDHPDRPLLADDWRRARSPWVLGTYLVANLALFAYFVHGTRQAWRTVGGASENPIR